MHEVTLLDVLVVLIILFCWGVTACIMLRLTNKNEGNDHRKACCCLTKLQFPIEKQLWEAENDQRNDFEGNDQGKLLL